jgi:phenylpropionate dioxygenase-like ring-hydroxylating dioxygenase large terminal subunit
MPHSGRHKPCFEKSKWGLVRTPRIETYRGLIFANWDENAESLDDYLAESKWYLDAFFNRSDAGTELIGFQKWKSRGNWKWGAEQHVSDFYHAQVSHVSYKEAFMPGASINRLVEIGEPEYGLQYSSPNRGHGAGWLTYPDEASMHQGLETMPQDVIDYTRDVQYSRVSERLGETRGEKMSIFHMTVFPNMSLNRGQGYLRLWQPISPEESEVWSFVFVDADMPEEIKQSYLTGKANTFSVSGALEQDDTENTTACQMGLVGAKASKTRLNIMMGEKKSPPDDFEGPGTISDEYSEVALRGYYRRWLELMKADG